MMSGFRKVFVLAILAMLCGTGFRYMVPLVASGTIDYALSSEAEGSRTVRMLSELVAQDWLAGNLWFSGVLMIVLTVLSGFFNFFKGKLAASASDGISRRLKNRLYNHLQGLPMRYHDKAETGDLVQRCTSDVETLRLAISTQVVEVSHALILMGLALPLMFLLDGRMAVASFILIGPIIVFGYIYIKRVRSIFQEFDEAEGKVTSVVQENLTGLRVVRAFRRQAYEIEKFSQPNQKYRDTGLRLIRLMALYWSVSDMIALSQNAVVLGLGVHFIHQGTLTVGTLFAFIMLLNLVLWPVRQMGRTLTELGKSVEDSITAWDPIQEQEVTYTDMNSFLAAYNYYLEDGLDEGIAVHPYGGVGEMQWAVNSAYDRSGEPVWVTEFAYWNAGSVDELYDYMILALDYLEHSPRVARYAWFKADLGSRGKLSLLSTDQTELSRIGELYVNYPVYDPDFYYPVNTRIEAEAYMQKSTSLQMQTSDIEGGMGALFNSRSFGWADYQISIEEAGTYTIRMRISKASYPALSEPVNTRVENPATGIERDLLMTTKLKAGQQTLRIWFKRLGAKFDWFEVLPGVRK
jgi:hypothetical protein